MKKSAETKQFEVKSAANFSAEAEVEGYFKMKLKSLAVAAALGAVLYSASLPYHLFTLQQHAVNREKARSTGPFLLFFTSNMVAQSRSAALLASYGAGDPPRIPDSSVDFVVDFFMPEAFFRSSVP